MCLQFAIRCRGTNYRHVLEIWKDGLDPWQGKNKSPPVRDGPGPEIVREYDWMNCRYNKYKLRAKNATVSNQSLLCPAFPGIHWFLRSAGNQRIHCMLRRGKDGQLSGSDAFVHQSGSPWPVQNAPKAERPPRFSVRISFQSPGW